MSRRLYDEFAVQIRLATSLRVSLCLIHGDCGTSGDTADVDKAQPHLAEIAYLVSGRQADDRETVSRLLGLRRSMNQHQLRQKVFVQLNTQGPADIVRAIGCGNVRCKRLQRIHFDGLCRFHRLATR
eukprot:GHVS01052853.1.p1 GENE.GHVS01052853.1~~GHVS01052853.1.p1  ORF type:complete len:127 (-),score=3.80 GHVS01052853.1:437-817(-)